MKQRKRALDSQNIRAKETPKLSQGGNIQGQASGAKPLMQVLGQGHWVWGWTHGLAIKEETIAINRDQVYNQACRLSHNIHIIQIKLRLISNKCSQKIQTNVPKNALSQNYMKNDLMKNIAARANIDIISPDKWQFYACDIFLIH